MFMRFDAPVQAMQLSGKSQFPYMVDPNTGTSMLESDNIINYLWQVGSPLQHIVSEPVLFRQGRPAPCNSVWGRLDLCIGSWVAAMVCHLLSCCAVRHHECTALRVHWKQHNLSCCGTPCDWRPALPGGSTVRVTATFLNKAQCWGPCWSLGQAQAADMAFRKSFCQTADGAFLFCLRLPLRCLLLCTLMTDATSVVPCRSMAMGRCLCR